MAEFGLQDEVVKETFGQDDQIVESFGQDDPVESTPASNTPEPQTVEDHGLGTFPEAVNHNPILRQWAQAFEGVPREEVEATIKESIEQQIKDTKRIEEKYTAMKEMAGDNLEKLRQVREWRIEQYKDLGFGVIEDKSPYEAATTPLIQLPKTRSEDLRALGMNEEAANVTAGIQQGVTQAAEFFTSPMGIATLGIGALPKAAQRLISSAFAVEMARQMPEIGTELGDAIGRGDTETTARSATHAVLNTIFVSQASRHALLGTSKAALLKQKMERVGQMMEKAVKDPLVDEILKRQASEVALDAASPKRILEKASRPAPEPTPSDATLSVVPPSTRRIMRFVEELYPLARDASRPVVQLDTTTPFPEYQPLHVATKVLSEPFALQRIPVLGILAGRRLTHATYDVDASIIRYRTEQGIGKAIAGAFGEEIHGRFDKVFKPDPINGALDVRARKGQSRFQSDVFEALQRDPNAYDLTPEQRAAWNEMKGYMRQLDEFSRRSGVDRTADNEMSVDFNATDWTGTTTPDVYWPRIAIKVPGVQRATRGGGVGSKQFFEKSRLFQSETEGVGHGVRYEPSIEKRMVTLAERVYRKAADKRLMNDPNLQGMTKAQKEADMRHAYAEELGSGVMTEKDFQNRLASVQAKGTVYQPGFFNEVFPPEIALRLNKEFPNAISEWRRNIVKAGNVLKAIKLGFDFGAPMIQGLPTLYANPKEWSIGVGKALQAFVDPKVFPNYVRENLPYVREIMQLGSSVGRLPEMVAGMSSGQPLVDVPKASSRGLQIAGRAVGQPVMGKVLGKVVETPAIVTEAFGRNFQTFLDVAKIELWKAWREVTPRSQWPELIKSIESQLLMGRMEGGGVRPLRALNEKTWLLASSYYRGAIAFVAGAGERGIPGRVLRRAMARFAGGGIATFVGVGAAIGMAMNELFKRLDPRRSDYLMWDVDAGEGRTLKVGFGGAHRSFLRLFGNLYSTAIENPSDIVLSTQTDKNPLARWLRGHASPVVSMAWDQASGRDFLGRDIDEEGIHRAFIPLPAEEIMRAPGEPKARPRDVVMSFLGFLQWPDSLAKQYSTEREKLSQAVYGKKYEGLRFHEQVNIDRRVSKRDMFAQKQPVTEAILEKANKNSLERQKRVFNGLNEQTRERLKKYGFTTVGGFGSSVTAGGVRMPLTRDQLKQLETFVIEEANIALARIDWERFDKKTTSQQSHQIDVIMGIARQRARARYRRAQGNK